MGDNLLLVRLVVRVGLNSCVNKVYFILQW